MLEKNSPSQQPRKREIIKHVPTGHDAMDADHKAIVECCNEIANCTVVQLPFFTRRLRSLLRKHFRNEERFVKEAGSTLCGCHQRDHQGILRISQRAVELSERDPKRATRLIKRDLVRTLRVHIAYRDQIVALRLNSIE